MAPGSPVWAVCLHCSSLSPSATQYVLNVADCMLDVALTVAVRGVLGYLHTRHEEPGQTHEARFRSDCHGACSVTSVPILLCPSIADECLVSIRASEEVPGGPLWPVQSPTTFPLPSRTSSRSRGIRLWACMLCTYRVIFLL